MKNTTAVGRFWEAEAAALLQREGYVILARNVRTRRGEIDLIANDGNILCFVEVRYTHSLDYGGPLATITWNKQRRIVRAAREYLSCHRAHGRAQMRFDVLGLWSQGHALIRGAFVAE